MSEILDVAVKALTEKLDGESMDGSVKFALNGVGSIRIDEDGVSINDDEADCTMSADADVFQDILEGNTNPTAAFMTGKLKIDGSMGMAMKLASLLS